ncbi:MAG: sporulation protein YunB [Oscillospiraceae bacterium]|nr:sporulation protein YunB [Oscillospiraceae bacterium]
MFSENKRAWLRNAGLKLIALSLIFIGMILLVDISLRPVVERTNEIECRAVVTDMINTAVTEELRRDDVDYDRLVELSTNDDGDVISVESNVMNINRLQANISTRLNRELERISAIDIEVPVGTLMGMQFFHGHGFDVGMSLQPIGYPKTQIISEFTEAGINQTRHRIIVQISVAVDAVVPGYSTDVTVSTAITAAETIIIGRVPDAYTHVVSSDGDLVGTLEDYEAETY